jgi:hypothetical protein
MCVSRLENCNISGVECGKIEFLKKPSRISIAFSDYFIVYSNEPSAAIFEFHLANLNIGFRYSSADDKT